LRQQRPIDGLWRACTLMHSQRPRDVATVIIIIQGHGTKLSMLAKRYWLNRMEFDLSSSFMVRN
jgi:hypothetical protein